MNEHVAMVAWYTSNALEQCGIAELAELNMRHFEYLTDLWQAAWRAYGCLLIGRLTDRDVQLLGQGYTRGVWRPDPVPNVRLRRMN